MERAEASAILEDEISCGQQRGFATITAPLGVDCRRVNN
jgi:hypothetical protein